jgi:photosystem II stability/assembly factor-like uncharacterized protein
MSNALLVATRKGLFRVERGEAGWRIGEVAFLGDAVSMTLRDPRDGAIYAGLGLGHFGVKLRRSDDGGRTWTELAALAFGSTTGSLWVTEDQGDHWRCVSTHLPPIYAVRFAE